MEGQGTIGREILNQTNVKLDYVFVPIGGGGLASGLGSYLKMMSPALTLLKGVVLLCFRVVSSQ